MHSFTKINYTFTHDSQAFSGTASQKKNKFRCSEVGLPKNGEIIRTYDNWQNKTHLQQYAILCIIGEAFDMNTVQVYFLNRLFNERPKVIPLFTLLKNLSEQPQRDTNIRKSIIKNLQMKNWTNLINSKQIHNSLKDIGSFIKQLLPKFEQLLDHDPTQLHYHNLTTEKLMKPITAAKFLLITRPCEHVILSQQMLKWSNYTPSLLNKRSNREHTLQSAPEIPVKYTAHEIHVRRQQVTFFPGLTSLEAHVAITVG